MKSEDVEKLERLLSKTKFERLSAEERGWVIKMLGSEEEFIALQKIEHEMSVPEFKSDLEPDERILSSLKRKMHDQKQLTPAWYSFLFVKIPAYATVLLIVISSTSAILFSQNSKAPKAIAASTIIKRDTVYISKIDTIFRERVIYRQARVAPQSFKEIQTARALEKVVPVSTGVSMKDKEELNKLLVSGSD